MTLPAEAGLERILGRGELAGAFFLHGDADRLRDEGVRRLVDAALDPATRDFNLSLFRGGDTEPASLAAALAMPPMMAPRRAVVLSDAQELTPTGRKVVERTLANLPPDLVFVISARIPPRSKAAFYRTLKERCRTLEWKEPREDELPGWAMERARARHGFELEPAAAQGLATAVGADLSLLDGELAKLATTGAETVDLDTVRALVPHIRRVDRWDWLDRVAWRRYEDALEDLDGVLSGDSAVGLVAGMVDQHLCVGLAVEGGAGLVRAVLDETGRGYLKWKASVYARQAGRWSAPEVRGALRLMKRADRQLKSGGTDRGVLQELLLALMHLPLPSTT